MNETFDFGFAPNEIVAREEYMAGRHAVDPQGVLIDNRPEFDSDMAHYSRQARKLRFLGIDRRPIVEVPYFRGETDDSFELEWKKYIADVRQLVATAANRSNDDIGAKAHPGNEEYYRKRLQDWGNDVDG
jgi:hypothetical protein